MQEQIRENRRPNEAKMFGSHGRRRLPGSLNGGVTADTVQLAICLVDRVGITSISFVGHAARNHAVGEGHQIDSEQLCTTLDLPSPTLRRTMARGVTRLEQA